MFVALLYAVSNSRYRSSLLKLLTSHTQVPREGKHRYAYTLLRQGGRALGIHIAFALA